MTHYLLLLAQLVGVGSGLGRSASESDRERR